MQSLSPKERRGRRAILIVAIAIALFSAEPYAGSWNDGSRLATVESLVDRETLVIDRSIFVDVPPLSSDRPSPYPRDDELLQTNGTKDKLFIDGHFYSDKPPVSALPMAGVYRVWRWCGGPSASERPDWFCRLMTWSSSGAAYVVAICCFYAIGRRIRLTTDRIYWVVATFAVGTVALPYAQQVNNHILLLAVAGWLFLSLLNGLAEGWPTSRLLGIGTLAGLGYTIDLGVGPLMGVAIGGLLLRRLPNRARLLWVVLAGLPWVFFHHGLNYWIGGTIGPANAAPAYFDWPGSPFSEQNMTGQWNHSSFGDAVLYACDMLFGKQGFLGHNLLLFLPLYHLPSLLRRTYPERPLVIAGLLWAVGTWLLYAATSNNLSGVCCSIRWFVPLLVPGFLAVCIVLRDRPETKKDLVILGAGSIALGIEMAYFGPWQKHSLAYYWAVYFGTLTVWLTVRWREDYWRS